MQCDFCGRENGGIGWRQFVNSQKRMTKMACKSCTNEVSEYLERLGYRLLVIPETDTEKGKVIICDC